MREKSAGGARADIEPENGSSASTNSMSDNRKTGLVTIRLAKTPEDLRAMALMGADAVAESPTLSRFNYDSERMWAKAWDKYQLTPKQYGLLLAERDGIVTGMLAAQIAPHLFVDALSAQCLVFYVRPEFRTGLSTAKLLKAYQRWGEQLGCDTLAIHVTSAVRMETTDRMLRKMGFAQTGGNYERKI